MESKPLGIDLNELFLTYEGKFSDVVQEMKAIGGKLSEDRGGKPHMRNDYSVSVSGLDNDRLGEIKKYALVWNERETMKRAAKGGDTYMEVRPNSYKDLLDLAGQGYVVSVEEICMEDRGRTPSD